MINMCGFRKFILIYIQQPRKIKLFWRMIHGLWPSVSSSAVKAFVPGGQINIGCGTPGLPGPWKSPYHGMPGIPGLHGPWKCPYPGMPGLPGLPGPWKCPYHGMPGFPGLHGPWKCPQQRNTEHIFCNMCCNVQHSEYNLHCTFLRLQLSINSLKRAQCCMGNRHALKGLETT